MYNLVTANTDLTTRRNLRAVHMAATAAAVVNLRNASVSGDIVVQLQIPINTSKELIYPYPAGLFFPQGLFVQVASGTVVGSVDTM